MTPASRGHIGAAQRKVEVVNFGCRLNLVESEAMRRLAAAQPGADLVIVNTCAVTAEAARQARQTIRRLKREQPEREIVVTGCAAQIDPTGFADMPQVARVIGNHEKIEAGVFAFDSARRFAVGDVFAPRPPAFRPSRASRTIRAPFSRSKTAAITAARSASSPMGAVPPVRPRSKTSSRAPRAASRRAFARLS